MPSPFATAAPAPIPAGGRTASPFASAAPAGGSRHRSATPAAPPPPISYPPTGEQEAIRDAYLTGGSLVVEAGAGTGKTSTLQLLGEATPRKKITYVVFNKAMAVEAESRFPRHVSCSTAHSLAWRAVVRHRGSDWDRRLSGPRMKSSEIARLLGIDPAGVPVETPMGERYMTGWRLAGWIMRALEAFCQSADPEPTERHFPYLDGIDHDHDLTNNLMLRATMLPYLQFAWADAQHPNGQLTWPHSRYVKLWQLSNPCLRADVVMFDEAQDASPVLRAVVDDQARYGSQQVYVGDSQQQIYEFAGARNALAAVTVNCRLQLSQSWRFGDPIADIANIILDDLGADLRLTGNPHRASNVGPLDTPDAILTRSNAAAISEMLMAQQDGIRAHLVGGGQEIIRFAHAARDLMDGVKTEHPDLACFDSWDDVLAYVAEDEQGKDLQLMVKVMSRFGPTRIIKMIQAMPREDEAELVISTAHKAKGREWDRVRVAGDYPTGLDEHNNPVEIPAEEKRLLYVTVTRARLQLDISAVRAFDVLGAGGGAR